MHANFVRRCMRIVGLHERLASDATTPVNGPNEIQKMGRGKPIQRMRAKPIGNASMQSSNQNIWPVPTDRSGVRTISRESVIWYPGHMNSAMRTMNRRLVTCDGIIEVHDARIPFSGRNAQLETWRGARPHVLILNKSDLAEMRHRDLVIRRLREEEGFSSVHFTTLNHPERVRSFLREVMRELVIRCDSEPRPNKRFTEARDREYTFLVCGIPNVGKSTLINAFRSQLTGEGKAAQVGKLAGVTRSVHERIRVSNDPRAYIIDTPGILAPSLLRDVRTAQARSQRERGEEEAEVALKVGACASVNLTASSIDVEAIADYVLFRLNNAHRFAYVHHFGLNAPTDNIMRLLAHVAATRSLTHRVRAEFTETATSELRPNMRAAASHFLADFNAGQLGRIDLDEHVLQLEDKLDAGSHSGVRRVPFILRGSTS